MSTSDLDNSFKSIEPPTAANIITWQFQVRLLLASAGVWDACMPVNPVTGLRPVCPVPNNANAPTVVEREAMLRYDTSRSKAVAAIGKAAGLNFLSVITPFLDQTDPGGLWDALELALAPRSGATRFNALQAFFNTTRIAGEAWSDLGGRIKEAQTRLQALFAPGFTLAQFLNELESFQFLKAFPDDNVTKITIIAGGNLDAEHVRATVSLLSDSSSTRTTEKATLATSPPLSHKRPNFCDWCNQNGHPESNCWSKSNYKALYLKEKAAGIHRTRTGDIAPARPVAEAGASSGPSSGRHGRGGGRHYQENTRLADTPEETAGIASSFISLADPLSDLWTADSGASRHMTPRKDWIYDLVPDRRLIKVADGRCIYSAGVGYVELSPIPKGVRGPAFRLSDVLYVPDLNANLISTNHLSQYQGFRINTYDSTTEFHLNNRILFTGTIRSNNLAYLDVDTRRFETAAHAFSQVVPASPQRWHQRWAHAGADLLKELRSSEAVKGFKVAKGPEVDALCEPCIEGKLHRAPHTTTAERATKPLERVSTDVHGPLPTRSRVGNQYWIVFVCQYSGLAAVYFMREKGEATEKFRLYKAWAENQLSHSIKHLRDDKGGEYSSHELQNLVDQLGIERERTIRDTPQQNGQAEHFNLTMEEAITAMLSQASLPPSMWQDAAATFVHLHNRKPSKSRDMRSPFELWHGRVPSVGHFRVWGCLAYVHLQKDQRAQLTPHAQRCVFIRYAHDAKGWVFWDTERRREIVSDSAIFDEEWFPGTLTRRIPRKAVEVDTLDDPNPEEDDPAVAPLLDPPAPPSNNPVPPLIVPTTDSPTIHPSTAPRLVIRIPSATERAELQRRVEQDRLDEVPRESRGLMDRTHFGSRHNDDDLPPRRGQRASASERGFIVEYEVEKEETKMNGAADKAHSGETRYPASANRVSGRCPASIPRSLLFEPLPIPDSSSPLIPLLNAVDFALSTSNSIEPNSLKEALSRPDADKYVAAAIDEIQAHLENKTWELTRLPAGKKAIGSRWVFKIKRNADGSVERYKGRIVAKGFAQRQGVDYTDTFAPTARFAALRSVIALAAIEDLELEAVDISTAFLNGEIDSEVYMEVPEGMEVEEKDGYRWVLKLLKGLYGIKQGPRLWARKLHKELEAMGFRRLECDHSVFIYMRGTVRIIVPVHVDDLLLASNDKKALVEFKKELGKRFKIHDLGPVKLILGIQLERDRRNHTISLSQTRYIEEMISEVIGDGPFNGTHVPMDDVRLSAKMGPQTKEEEDFMKRVDYRALVGKLLYLSIATRPDISYAVGVLCRFNDNPGPQHWEAAKKILRYLQQTKDLKLVYSPSTSVEPFVVYSDADLGGDPDTSRSTAGYMTRIGSGAVSWGSRLHKHTSLSSTEAEYTTASAAGTELMWMRYFLEECGYNMSEPSTLLIDNASAIQVAKNPEHQSTMKHVHREYHWIRENVEKGLIRVLHVPGTENVADIFTKPLKRPIFTHLRELLGLRY